MSLMQRISKYAYLCLMSLGALVAILGIISAIRSIQPDGAWFPGSKWWDYPVLVNGLTGLALLLMSLAFFAIFIRRGTHLLAPFLYIASYVANVFGFVILLTDIEERGAPGPRLTMANVYLEAAVCLGPALFVTAAGLIWNYRAASRTRAL